MEAPVLVAATGAGPWAEDSSIRVNFFPTLAPLDRRRFLVISAVFGAFLLGFPPLSPVLPTGRDELPFLLEQGFFGRLRKG